MRNTYAVPMVRGLSCIFLLLSGNFAVAEREKATGTPPPHLYQQRITIASYNAENLWDQLPENTPDAWEDFLDSLPQQQRSKYSRSLQYADYAQESSNWYNRSVLQAKAQHMVESLKLLEFPDIVGLQEIESAGNSSKVFDLPYSEQQTLRQKLEELGYSHFLVGPQEKNNPVAVTTAFISKLPIKNLDPVAINFGASTSCRDIQVVELLLPAGRALIFNSHWKSKIGGGEENREETAKLLRERIAKERRSDPTTDIIALGDFNSSYYESPMQVLKTTGDQSKMLGRPTPYLYNLWFEVPEEDRWDYSFDGIRSILSHMLISDSLFDDRGLQYVDKSYVTVGQHGDASKILLNVDGRPYRWQKSKTGDRINHIGQGYSDHLPLRATFIVHNNENTPSLPSPKKKGLPHPSHGDSSKPPAKLLLDKVDRCQLDEARDIHEISPSTVNSFIGTCVKLDLPSNEEPYQLRTWGPFHSVYISVNPDHARRELESSLRVGITMTRAFDWRPNVDDSRVSMDDILNATGKFNSRRSHPLSNMCYIRRVLQKEGGQIRRAVGKLSYQDGYLAIFVATRESQDLILEDLPEDKLDQCVWEQGT